VWGAPGVASPALPTLVTDLASTATPRVVGGQCYTGVPDPSACRRVLALIGVGNWIYVGGIISDVYDAGTNRTVSGFHNLFRFNATTHLLDTGFKPQLYRTLSSYVDAGVTGLAASPDGSTIYAAGSFTTVASGPGAAGVTRRGVAAFNATSGAVLTQFNANVGAGGGSAVVNDVDYVGNTLWLGGAFSRIGGSAQAALASVAPATGARTTAVADQFSGKVTSTSGTKVARIAINPQQTRAAVIGNFAQVDGVTHKEVVLINIDATTGASMGASTWNAPTYLNGSQTNCSQKDTWARGVDWDPTGTYFDIAASGGGGFDAFPGLCDAFSRFYGADNNPNSVPLIVNFTGFDSLFAVCDTGDYAYTGGHNKNLNHSLYINGKKVSSGGEEKHYGLGAISVNPNNPGYGKAVTSWNASTATGRGAGWAACLTVTGGSSSGGGVYMGGDSINVNGDAAIKRLAYFPGP
jgi:hypothetical protein